MHCVYNLLFESFSKQNCLTEEEEFLPTICTVDYHHLPLIYRRRLYGSFDSQLGLTAFCFYLVNCLGRLSFQVGGDVSFSSARYTDRFFVCVDIIIFSVEKKKKKGPKFDNNNIFSGQKFLLSGRLITFSRNSAH